MSWKEIKLGEIGEGEPKVTIGSNRRSPPACYAQIVVNLSASIAKFIRVNPGGRVKLEVGSLGDDGWMRISSGDDQLATRHGHDGSVRIRFSGRRFGIQEKIKPEVTKHKLITSGSDHYVVFMLPPWARKESADGS